MWFYREFSLARSRFSPILCVVNFLLVYTQKNGTKKEIFSIYSYTFSSLIHFPFGSYLVYVRLERRHKCVSCLAYHCSLFNLPCARIALWPHTRHTIGRYNRRREMITSPHLLGLSYNKKVFCLSVCYKNFHWKYTHIYHTFVQHYFLTINCCIFFCIIISKASSNKIFTLLINIGAF